MATAKFDIKTEALRPVLAGVGVTDLAVEVVREAVAHVQKRVAADQKTATARVVDVQKTAGDPKALRDQAVTVVSSRVDALAKDAQARRAAVESRVAELQAEAKAYPAKVSTLVDGNVAAANATYVELVKRGESLVGRIRRQESTKATATAAQKTATSAVQAVTEAAEKVGD